MISHQIALHSVQLPKTNIANVKAKPLMQDRSAIAKNEFENYKINTERANENKNKKQNKTKTNTSKFNLVQPKRVVQRSHKDSKLRFRSTLGHLAVTLSRPKSPSVAFTGTAGIRFLGRDTVFCQSAVHLNKTIKCRQLLYGFRRESCRQPIKSRDLERTMET